MGYMAGRKGPPAERVMTRSTLLLGAWIWACLAAAPILLYLVFVAGSHGGVAVPLTPSALNHALTQWASAFGNRLANQIGGA